MFITNFVNKIAENLSGLTAAGSALSTAIIGWVMFWRSTARLIPTEWKNPVLGGIFKMLHTVCTILGLDLPDIAKIDWHRRRIITKGELVATQVVNAAVIPSAVVENPSPPAAPTTKEST